MAGPRTAWTQVIRGAATLPDSGPQLVERHLGLVDGLGYWAALVTALVAATWLLFRRRDVT